MSGQFSRGGYMPSAKPLLMTRRPGGPCACGERTHRFDGGPDEHLIPSGMSVDEYTAWAARCPLLRIEGDRAREAVGRWGR